MNPSATSREEIMSVCREIAAHSGLNALSVRNVARECGVAPSTLYNYYSDKDEITLATVESIWQDIFHTGDVCETDFTFPQYVEYLFDCAKRGAQSYPSFLTAHSVALAGSRKGEAKNTMERYFSHMKTGMLEVLHADKNVSEKAFTPALTEDDLMAFVLDNILLLLMKGAQSCSALCELICRIIYP